MIGNSSAGIREAPAYGVPSINIGSRQNKRAVSSTIINCEENPIAISEALRILPSRKSSGNMLFGKGHSDRKFFDILSDETVWNLPKQKQFIDM